MLEKVNMLKDNNGVGTVKKFTPPSPPLNHVSRGGEMSFKGGKKNFGVLRAPFLPLTQISPPPTSFPRSAPVSNPINGAIVFLPNLLNVTNGS